MIIFVNVFVSTCLLNAHCLPGVLTGTEVVAGSKIKILALMGSICTREDVANRKGADRQEIII